MMRLLNICLDDLLKPPKLDDNFLNFHDYFAAQFITREVKRELAFMTIAKECVEGIMTLDRKSSRVREDSQGNDVKILPEQVSSTVGRQRALLTFWHTRWGWLLQGHGSVPVWRQCKHFRGQLLWSCISPHDSPAIREHLILESVAQNKCSEISLDTSVVESRPLTTYERLHYAVSSWLHCISVRVERFIKNFTDITPWHWIWYMNEDRKFKTASPPSAHHHHEGTQSSALRRLSWGGFSGNGRLPASLVGADVAWCSKREGRPSSSWPVSPYIAR